MPLPTSTASGLQPDRHDLRFGSNAGGYQGPVFDTTLALRATVDEVAVPEPETYLLMAFGMITLWVARRRSPRRERFGA